MCFNLRFDSEEELAAIAAGMSGDTATEDSAAPTPTDRPSELHAAAP